MAQSALTVTPPNPSPPTNMSCGGVSGPNPPNITRGQYSNPFNLTAVNSPSLVGDGRPQAPYGVNPSPAPYFDDAAGGVGNGLTFQANTAALTGGTSAADNGISTNPGTNAAGAGGTGFNSVSGSYIGAANGVVPAATSVAAEGAGTETLFTQSYSASILNPNGPLLTVGCGPAQTAATIAAGPNATHASSLSPVTNPTLTSLGTPSTASGVGTVSQTVTGTNFTRQSVIYVNGVAQTTNYTSATSLTAPAVTKKAAAGTWPVTVVTGGAVTTTAQTWTFT